MVFLFNSFRLDVGNASLNRAKQAIVLTPKSFSMLRHLVEHAGQLVSKDDLWSAVLAGNFRDRRCTYNACERAPQSLG